jgi:pimeloyl-ACP methyl ester carboxylesterase
MKRLTIFLVVIMVASVATCKKQASDKEIIMKESAAEVNGTRLYYEIAGSGDPIVLIHGNGGDRRHWDDQFEVFAKNYKVIRYDVRGFGKSALPVLGERYSHHDDLRALLKHLGISKANICGLSMGCGIALDFVLAYPEMSKSLIAVGPWAFGYNSPSANELFSIMGELSSIVREEGTKAAYDYWINTPLFKNSLKNPKVVARMKEIGYDYSFWHFVNEDPGFILDPPAMKQIDKINLPALIVTAEYDLEACKEIAGLLEQNIPNAKKVVISDAGHVMNKDKPAEFNKIVLDFLSEIANQ